MNSLRYLVFAGVIALFFACNKKDPEHRYDCISGICEVAASGVYSNFDDCYNDCSTQPSEYDCVAGNCELVIDGTYSTLNSCQSVCASGGGSGGGGGGSGNTTATVYILLDDAYGSYNLECLLPITVNVTAGHSASTVCPYGTACNPCGSGFKNFLIDPGKSYGKTTVSTTGNSSMPCNSAGAGIYYLPEGKYTIEWESKACVFSSSANANIKGFHYTRTISIQPRDLDKECVKLFLGIGPFISGSVTLQWLKDNCQ